MSGHRAGVGMWESASDSLPATSLRRRCSVASGREVSPGCQAPAAPASLPAGRLAAKEIGKGEMVSNHGLPDSYRNAGIQHRTRVYKGMELSPLAAGVHAIAQSREKRLVEFMTGERSAIISEIDAGQTSATHCTTPDRLT